MTGPGLWTQRHLRRKCGFSAVENETKSSGFWAKNPAKNVPIFHHLHLLLVVLDIFPPKIWLVFSAENSAKKCSASWQWRWRHRKQLKRSKLIWEGLLQMEFGHHRSTSFLGKVWMVSIPRGPCATGLMSRGKKCLPTVSRQFLTRNYPRPNCLLKCLPNCLSPTREGFLSSFKINPAVRVIARQVRDKNCLAAIFAPRHQSVSSGPLGRGTRKNGCLLEVRSVWGAEMHAPIDIVIFWRHGVVTVAWRLDNSTPLLTLWFSGVMAWLPWPEDLITCIDAW